MVRVATISCANAVGVRSGGEIGAQSVGRSVVVAGESLKVGPGEGGDGGAVIVAKTIEKPGASGKIVIEPAVKFCLAKRRAVTSIQRVKWCIEDYRSLQILFEIEWQGTDD